MCETHIYDNIERKAQATNFNMQIQLFFNIWIKNKAYFDPQTHRRLKNGRANYYERKKGIKETKSKNQNHSP